MDRRQGGGQILERGSHHIDLQRAIGGEIAFVEAAAGSVRLAQDSTSQGDIDDALVLLLHFHSGAIGSVNMAWARDGHPERYAVDVLASDASLWLELGPERFALTGVAAGVERHAESGDPLQRSIDRFLEVARSGDRGRVFCAPDDALRTLIVALACEQALAARSLVTVSPTA